MFKTLIAASLATGLLSACSNSPVTSMAHDKPVVNVFNGQVHIAPDPLEFKKDEVNVTIIWSLVGSAVSFPDDGIVFDRMAEGEIVECKPIANNMKFQCKNRHSKPGTYKYTINVIQAGNRISLDPSIVNF